ncbi:MAG: hypothetical protein KF838_06185 [Phycisphaeraceae bacterium]|nr:MAG: hypothetical protein KF838_06185 [Phycisphaeraceae bacterium]
MLSINRHAERRTTPNMPAAILALSAAVGLASASSPAHTQDCKLTIHATPNVVYTGQSAAVDVIAHFPTGMYALASAQFDVRATMPMWSSVSSGVIAGSDVTGMAFTQPHAPHVGVYANPSNPNRIWFGRFTPKSDAPALVEIKADPTAMSVYPNKLTPSSVPGVATGGSAWVLANPLSVGRWRAAPGNGTNVSVSDDVIVDGRIITAENNSGVILMGLLLPAVQQVRESASIIDFDGRPDSFTATVQVQGAVMEELSLNYTKVVWQNNDDQNMYALAADMGGASAEYGAFLGGVVVAAGDLNADGTPILIDRIPDEIAASVKPNGENVRTKAYLPYTLENALISSWSTSGNGGDAALIVLPSGRTIIADTLAIRSSRPIPSTNIKQLGLGMHTFEAAGVRRMIISPVQPE